MTTRPAAGEGSRASSPSLFPIPITHAQSPIRPGKLSRTPHTAEPRKNCIILHRLCLPSPARSRASSNGHDNTHDRQRVQQVP
ncbi:hypothetical protein CALCODRAFT_7885 [Calocera cornea HHB12733]|uniref:Uncharacterized protein n=1 Tax=Calocera cornea HHB12733 TaxID=1353952 RepID=A0A165KD30_9BASI|nr:hypothetical protein CALCODRAFT_7885 [Calocera cornea HHB12733]